MSDKTNHQHHITIETDKYGEKSYVAHNLPDWMNYIGSTYPLNNRFISKNKIVFTRYSSLSNNDSDETNMERIEDYLNTQYEARELRQTLRERLLARKLLDGEKFEEVEFIYSGYGDSGDIEECKPDEEGLSDFLWNRMWDLHAGFENNSGGGGEITWDLHDDVITINHYDTVETSEYTETEI